MEPNPLRRRLLAKTDKVFWQVCPCSSVDGESVPLEPVAGCFRRK